MMATEKQRSYICYALRANRMDKMIPNRMEEHRRDLGMGGTQVTEINHVWLDLNEWMVKNLSSKDATQVIGFFKDDKPVIAFARLRGLGMPVSK